MASRPFRKVEAVPSELKLLPLSFAVNGASNPTAASIKGTGIASVVHTSTGLYTITLEDKYSDILSAVATPAVNAQSEFQVELGAIDVVSAKTVVVCTLVSGARADVAAQANRKVHVLLCLKNGSNK